jgi:chitinase
MYDNDYNPDASTDSSTTDAPAVTTNDDRESSQSLSRRGFLRASAGVGAGALALGGATPVSARVVEKACDSYGTIPIDGGEFDVINNDWGAPLDNSATSQCVFKNSDGSYGWNWERGSAGNINYPQVLVGGKPWGSKTDTSVLPKQWGNINDLDLALDIDNQIQDGGEWDLAEEFWVTRNEPDGTNVSNSIKNEIMLVLEWGSGHSHGGVEEPGAITDKFGNTIDFWAHYSIGWSFYIFRIPSNETPDKVDLRAIMDYLENDNPRSERFPDNHWVSGIELGNENWSNTAGKTTLNQFDVRVNNQIAASGVNDQWGPGSSDGGSESDLEPIDSTMPTDPDSDGSYEDLNGNGEIDFDDSVVYFEHMDEAAMTDHTTAYDYNANNEIDYADIVKLFERAN